MKPRVCFLVFLPLLFLAALQTAGHCCVAFGNYEGCGSAGHHDPGGGTPGGGPSPAPTPSFGPTDPYDAAIADVVGIYSYATSSTNCWGDTGNKDPITVVSRLDPHGMPSGVNTFVGDHIGHHGWGNPSDGGQYFRHPINNCAESNVNGDNEDPPAGDRWHVRTYYQVYNWDPWIPIAEIAGMTPHYDDEQSCGHVVPSSMTHDGEVKSGFRAGRDELTDRWSESDHHRVIDARNWKNTDLLEQCDTSLTQSNGIVYYIGLCAEAGYPC